MTSILEDSARRLFRRCVICPTSLPVCPQCAANQKCSLLAQTCNQCASTRCIDAGGSSDSDNSGGTPVGAIAGGVVGGIVLVIIIVGLWWWFRLRKHRKNAPEPQPEPEEWEDNRQGIEKDDGPDQYSMRHNARASTHTVGSVSSALTGRASNIIQIAYIPGVTNRSLHSSPDLIPPVPPIPAASTGGSTHTSPHMSRDQHFFLPGDLRQSTYSERTDRSSFMQSRNSVASTIYRNDAVVNPMPAQTLTRMKPTAVSVKSSIKTTPSMSRSASPPRPGSSSQATSTTAPTLNTKSSIVGKFAQPRAITVTRKTSNRLKPNNNIYELDGSSVSERSVSPISGTSRKLSGATSPQYSHQSSTFDDGSSDDDDTQQSQRLMSNSRQSRTTTITESPNSPQYVPSYQRSPELGGPSKNIHQRNSSIPKAIEEATRKAAQTNVDNDYGFAQPETSPFSDAHIARTP
jgi:protein OPY2